MRRNHGARSIEINIERLILEGYDVRRAESIGEQIRDELARLISEGGLPSGGADLSVPHRTMQATTMAERGMPPGIQAARAIYGRMGK